MYHKLHPSRRDALTLTPKQFEDQLVWLKETNYRFVRLAEVLATADAQENSFSDGRRAVLLTFDDGFLSNLTWAYPILVKHQIPAVVFLPTAFLGKSSSWELQNAEAILTPAQLKTMSPLLIEFGLHSHQHLNYGKLTTAQIKIATPSIAGSSKPLLSISRLHAGKLEFDCAAIFRTTLAVTFANTCAGMRAPLARG